MSTAIRTKLLPRQVHIWMRPSPRNLSETRLVLRELQKFGEVATFLNLKYEYRQNVKGQSRSILAIFESDRAAADAIKTGTFVIRLPKYPSEEDLPTDTPAAEAEAGVKDHFIDEATDATVPQPTDAFPEIQEQDSDAPDIRNTRMEEGRMYCTILASEHNHEVTARENPYNRAFHLSRKSLEIQDLVHRYNDEMRGGVPQLAMADCFARRKRPIPYRFSSEILKANEELGANSLMGMWMDGKNKEGLEGSSLKEVWAEGLEKEKKKEKVREKKKENRKKGWP